MTPPPPNGTRIAARMVAACAPLIAIGLFIGGHMVRANATLDGSYWDELTLPWLLWIGALGCLIISAIALAISVSVPAHRQQTPDRRGFEVLPAEDAGERGEA